MTVSLHIFKQPDDVRKRPRLLVQWTFLAALAFSIGSGCASPGGPRTGQVEGHNFKTRIDCARTGSADTFDRRCDIPVLGYRGFNGL
jgi:hypothetical protein